jgi:hypothetical protein
MRRRGSREDYWRHAVLTAGRPGGASRSRRHIRRLDLEVCKIDVLARGRGVVAQDGREASLGPGAPGGRRGPRARRRPAGRGPRRPARPRSAPRWPGRRLHRQVGPVDGRPQGGVRRSTSGGPPAGWPGSGRSRRRPGSYTSTSRDDRRCRRRCRAGPGGLSRACVPDLARRCTVALRWRPLGCATIGPVMTLRRPANERTWREDTCVARSRCSALP